jgi:polyribonucleotide nucleotidyltransferase
MAGTQKGITALQLDLKVAGLDREVLARAMMKGKEVRLEVLKAMLQALREPREKISPYAPRLLHLTIDRAKIGQLIGPGGKMIRGLEEEWECSIDVEDDGTVTLASDKGVDIEALAAFIERMLGSGGTANVDVGATYEGTVTELKDFGAIVELLPGTDGLCHISQLDEGYVRSVGDVCKVGDKIKVKVLAVEGNRIKLSRKSVLQDEK